MELTNCSGKKFSVLAEMGGSGGESVVKKVRKVLEEKGMTFVASAITVEKDVEAGAAEATVEEFAEKIREG
jgi:flavorubredoxin